MIMIITDNVYNINNLYFTT